MRPLSDREEETMNIKHMIDFNDLSPEQWNEIYTLAKDIVKCPSRYSAALRGKVMATLFYEPSTRTQMSFQTAMLRLGGSLIGFSDPKSSSVSKGETLRDTIKIISNYADIAVIRNPIEGAAYAASLYSRIPVINAGDGGHLHPTQTMTDMLTIGREKGRFEGMSIGLCGDLANGRTVHSLLKAFSRYKNNTFYLISTQSLRLPDYFKKIIAESDNKIIELNSLDECIAELDILYMTRIQRERFASIEEYEAQSGIFVLTADKMSRAKKDLTVMHPLPKVDEIDPDVDDDDRCRFFAQAENGLYVRMALILTLCESNPFKLSPKKYELPKERFCKNPRCISNHERYLPKLTKSTSDGNICAYCENLIK